jgi:hypothetical protein
MKIVLWEILVPCKMRGKPVRTRHHREWDKLVRKITGGLTILKPARGQWVEPNTKALHEERVIPVRIACTRKQIDRIIDITIRHYDQKAVMAYCISIEVIIKHKEEVAHGP